MNETNGSAAPRDSPYFGLDYYEEKFGAWFFGRETEGGKIITNLRAARLTLLHAESGVGKSSLLRAGVAWRMRRLADDSLARRGTARFVPVVFSSWKDDPVLELAGAIRTAIGPYLAGRPEPELLTDRLNAVIGAASGAVNASLLIMLDQFEEYFLYRSREPTPERFADELARCINRADLRANFLIAIREDAYAGLGDLFKGRIANVYGNYLHVEYLDRASAEKAIREPLDIYNGQPDVSEHVKIQDELVEAVLNQVRAFDGDVAQGRAAAANGGGGRVATPLLQLVMETVWERERAEGSHELRLSTLQSLRGVRMIVDAHLGKALSSLSDGERQTAIDMFDELVTPSGGKIAESVPDLAQRTGHSEDQAGSVLDKLDHERIVRPIPAAPGQDPMRFRRYEIFHDVLGPAINNMIAAREERRRARRLRRFAALAVGLLIVALAIVGVFAYLWHSATTAKLTAESRQLAADAEVNATRDPELSVLLALQALRLHYTSQAEDALRAVLPELQAVRTFRGGTTVYSAAFDPVDANKVASADRYGAWIWDVKTGHRVRMSLGGFAVTGAAYAVAFNPAGTEVAVGYADGKVALFDARGGRELQSANVFGVNDVEFVGSTGELAIATEQGLALWQPQNRSRCCDILSHEQANTIAADPRNPLEFAVTTVNGTVIWNVSGSGKPRQQRLPQGPWSTNDAAFSPEGSEVVTADSDGNVRVYDLATFKAVMTLDAGEANAWSVAFSPHGKGIVAGYSSGRARVWDVSTRLQLTLLAGSASGVEAARFNADGSEVVTASHDGTIRVWHSQPRELQTEFASSSSGGTPNPVGGARYISSSRILTLDGSERLYVFTASGKQQAVIDPGTVVKSAAWNPAGTEIVTADSNRTVDLWHVIGSNYTQIPPPSPIHLNGPPLNVGMSPDGFLIAIVTPDSTTIQMRSTHSGKLVKRLYAVHAISVVAFSPSGRQILTGGKKGQVEVWDAAQKTHRVLGTPGPSISDVEFNKSGSEFVTASESGVVTIWAARDDRPLRSIDACASPNTASFSPDGSKIVIACGDGSAPVFAAATGRQLTVLSAASAGTVSTAAFSPDGKTIVTAVDAGDAGGVQIWNSELATPSLRTLERLAEQRLTRKLTAAERKEYLTGISG